MSSHAIPMPAVTEKEVHLRDYDLDTVAEITRAPKDLIERLAEACEELMVACDRKLAVAWVDLFKHFSNPFEPVYLAVNKVAG